MYRFWDDFLAPLARACEPAVIVEIGSQYGHLTRKVLEYCTEAVATAHVIDPTPEFDVEQWQGEFGSALVFHRALSLEALRDIPPPDLVLIDGDHNWYTVINELGTLARRAADSGHAPPVVALHDVGWPYGRRDMYYDPATVPREYRQPYARRGLRPESAEPVDDGMNAHLANAIIEGGPRNGVLTAVEDFLREAGEPWELETVPGFHGLGLLVPQTRLIKNPKLAAAMRGWSDPSVLRRHVEAVERNRLEGEVLKAEAARLREARTKAEKELEALRPPLVAAEEESAALRSELEALRPRLVAAEEESAALRSELDALRLRLVAAEEESADLRSELGQAESSRRRELRSITTDLSRIGASRSWRYGHRIVRVLRRLALRPVGRDGDPVTALLDRIEELERPPGDGPSRSVETASPSGARPPRGDASMRPGPRGLLGRGRSKAQAVGRRTRSLVPFQADAVERTALRIERAQAAAFLRRYGDALPTLVDTAPDDSAEVVPVDRDGLLASSADPADEPPTVDVVVCIHDALADLRRCLFSLLEKTGRHFHLILVDDGSGPQTQAFLARFVDANPAVTLITREGPPHGYTLAANDGVRASAGDYVILLNSDTIVTFGWLDRLVACGESDAAIGLIGPLSNAATHQSVPELREGGAWAVNELPSFLTADGVAALLAALSPRTYPRLPFINGFCYGIKRPVIDSIGLFDDERFASGYCEENDYSYRARQASFELAVADDAYVFHAKSKSYGQEGRREVAKRNYRLFLKKHGEQNIKPLVERLENDKSLEPVRELVSSATADEGAFTAAFPAIFADPLRIGFVLHGLGSSAAGGVHSIYQEASGMRSLGIDARVFVPSEGLENARLLYPEADEVFSGFSGDGALGEATADRDVLVATHFRSVEAVQRLAEQRNDFLPAYYIQDYEAFFFEEGALEAEEALESYTAIPGALLFAKTRWLCDLVSGLHDRPVRKVEPSIDHSVYHPVRSRPSAGPLRVLGMVRPRTWRRQPLGTLRVLDRLQTDLGSDVEVQVFGAPPHELRRLTPARAPRVENIGLLTREGVADALRSADVFLDFSVYQAFGRTALEAMACGCAVVVPRIGGAAEYAVHGENALVVDTSSEDAAVEALTQLAGGRDVLRAMQGHAIETAAGFSVLRAALSEYLLFANEHARRRTGVAATPGHSA